MYKVILIDDEEIIVEGLAKLMPWEKYNAKVVALAHDAATGTEIIRKHKPDIIFTDIRMPDGDGLSMLAGLRSEYPNMQVTVLTGYRDFDYAQKAVHLGVTRFLLKPSKMSELEEALATMVERLKNLTGAPEEPAEEDSISNLVVREAVEYIETNYAKKIALEDVAEACYVSQWHLSKLLQQYANASFYEILNSARVEASKELLVDPSLRIGEIAEMVGYSGTPHFSRVFKKIEGKTPNEYRNQI